MDQHAQKQWSELYRQALLECDEGKLHRIEEAEKAIQQRAHELWYADTPQRREQRDLDVALHFLGLLRILALKNGANQAALGLVA